MNKELYQSFLGGRDSRTRTLGTIKANGKTYIDVKGAAELVGVSHYTIRNYDYNGLINDTITRDRVKYYEVNQVKAAHTAARDKKARTGEQRFEQTLKTLSRSFRQVKEVLDKDTDVTSEDKKVISAFLGKHYKEISNLLK